MIQKLKKALQRMWDVFRRHCYYSYREHFFAEVLVELQNADLPTHT